MHVTSASYRPSIWAMVPTACENILVRGLSLRSSHARVFLQLIFSQRLPKISWPMKRQPEKNLLVAAGNKKDKTAHCCYCCACTCSCNKILPPYQTSTCHIYSTMLSAMDVDESSQEAAGVAMAETTSISVHPVSFNGIEFVSYIWFVSLWKQICWWERCLVTVIFLQWAGVSLLGLNRFLS